MRSSRSRTFASLVTAVLAMPTLAQAQSLAALDSARTPIVALSTLSIAEASVLGQWAPAAGRAGRALTTVTVGVDLEHALHLRGGRISGGVQLYSGPMLSTMLLQPTSNIENSESFARLGELYYEQELAEGRVRLKVGQVDANSDFAAGDATALFLSAAAQLTPVAAFLPSYPQPVPSVNAFVRATSWLTVGAGVYDGTWTDGNLLKVHGRFRANTLFSIGQAKAQWTGGTATLAAWHQAGDLPTVSGATVVGTHGAQLRVEQAITGVREGGSEAAAPGLTLIGQLAVGEAGVSPVHAHAAVGFTVRGALGRPSREVMGVLLSNAAQRQSDGRSLSEAALEAFHLLPVTPRLSVQPALDLVRMAMPDHTLTFGATMRATLSF